VQRYSVLAATACKQHQSDPKKATQAIIEEIKLDSELFRIGLTKVLFKAGVLGTLEELRDEAISKVLIMLQAQMRKFLTKMSYKKLLSQRLALAVMQRNVKAYITLRNWGWWKLFANIKPLLQWSKKEEERKAREAEEARLKELERIENERRAAMAKELEEANVKLLREKNELFQELSALRDVSNEHEKEAKKLGGQKADLEAQIRELKERLASEEAQAGELGRKKKGLEGDLNEMRKEAEELAAKIKRLRRWVGICKIFGVISRRIIGSA